MTPGAPTAGWRSQIERIALLHAALLVIGCSWWFGGQSDGARTALLAWGTLGALLFGFLLTGPGNLRRITWWLVALVAFDLLVILSSLNPSTREIVHEGERLFLHTAPRWPGLPSSARPDLSLRELWQFNAIVLSCANVFLALRRRSDARRFLGAMCANVLLLSIFGTFQKLAGATGIWFGLIPTPQTYFFSTFVYHNHWGAFILLHLAACLGLIFHAFKRGDYRDVWHSPLPIGAVAILFIAATAPLSGSRSTTVLVAALLTGALIQFLWSVIRERRRDGRSAVGPVTATVAAAIVGAAGIVYLAREVIALRLRITTEQVTTLRAEDQPSTRAQLYRDTWRMAAEKPWFGWGLETYGDVFRIYNTQRDAGHWRNQPFYREAHNDWLQTIAEVGFAGAAGLGAMMLAPLLPLRRRHRPRLAKHLLAGGGIVLAYAAVEFPFANPAVMISFWLLLFISARYAQLESGPEKPVR